MSEATKATRTTIQLSDREIDGFMLPDGSYRMSLSQAAECVGLTARNAFDFLQSKTFNRLMGKGYTVSISEIEADSEQARGQSRIRALPLDVVSKYWHWQSHRGNKQAFALVDGLITESLERRFDAAFGVQRSEQERNHRLAQQIAELEGDLNAAIDMESVSRGREEYLESRLRQHGIEPWGTDFVEDSNDG